MYYSQSKWKAYRIIRLMYLMGYPKWTVKTRVAYDIGRENNAFWKKDIVRAGKIRNPLMDLFIYRSKRNHRRNFIASREAAYCYKRMCAGRLCRTAI